MISHGSVFLNLAHPCAYSIHYIHTLPHLDRPTLNDLQSHRHERVSLVCVRAQSPPGLALVSCALLKAVDKRGRKKCLVTHTHTFYDKINKKAPDSRTIRYEGFFFLGKRVCAPR